MKCWRLESRFPKSLPFCTSRKTPSSPTYSEITLTMSAEIAALPFCKCRIESRKNSAVTLAGCTIGKRSHDSLCVLRKTGSQLPKPSKKILLSCLCCERKISMTKEIEIYKVSMAVLRNFLKSGLLTQSEFVQCEQTLAEKCGLSLGSIFRESA